MFTMYCFRDRISGNYEFPFAGSDKPDAVKRGIRDALITGGSMLWQRFPNDHELYSVGCFDVHSGKIAVTDPLFICNLSELVGVANG